MKKLKDINKIENNLNQVDSDLIEERTQILMNRNLSKEEGLKQLDISMDKIMSNMIAKGLDVTMDEKFIYIMAMTTLELKSIGKLFDMKI